MEVYPRSRVFLARTLRLVYAHACPRDEDLIDLRCHYTRPFV